MLRTIRNQRISERTVTMVNAEEFAMCLVSIESLTCKWLFEPAWNFPLIFLTAVLTTEKVVLKEDKRPPLAFMCSHMS